MAAFIAVVLATACVFYGYALARFGREIRAVRAQRPRGVPLVIPFRGMPEVFEPADSSAQNKVTVLPVSRTARRDVA